MCSQQNKIIQSNSSVFVNNFLDAKGLFTLQFGHVPCISWINHVNTRKLLDFIREKYAANVKATYQYSEYKTKKGVSESTVTIIEMNNTTIVELRNEHFEVLHGSDNYEFANQMLKEASNFKAKNKRKPFEINLIVKDSYGLELRAMEIKKTKLDIDLYYDDSFKDVDAVIQKRIGQKNDKGIVLLHGLPGTGKTTYLRYLVGKIKKKVLFLTPNVAGNLMDPDFINLLIDNPNSVVVIEDAENIIMDRKLTSGSSVSNLLNISDGLLADFLNVQVICTFNNSLTMVDSALTRKGRLIAKYEFGKLPVSKSQKLSDHFGNTTTIDRPMTIAEIANQHEKEFEVKPLQILGFRREILEN